MEKPSNTRKLRMTGSMTPAVHSTHFRFRPWHVISTCLYVNWAQNERLLISAGISFKLRSLAWRDLWNCRYTITIKYFKHFHFKARCFYIAEVGYEFIPTLAITFHRLFQSFQLCITFLLIT